MRFILNLRKCFNHVPILGFRLFFFEKIEGNDSSFLEFEMTGSTYEPIGELFLKGQKVKGNDFETLHELGTICIMCNDSAIDFNEFKQAFEKVSLKICTSF